MIGPTPQGCVGVAPVLEQLFLLGVQVVQQSVRRTQQRDPQPDLPSWPDEHPQQPLRGPAATGAGDHRIPPPRFRQRVTSDCRFREVVELRLLFYAGGLRRDRARALGRGVEALLPRALAALADVTVEGQEAATPSPIALDPTPTPVSLAPTSSCPADHARSRGAHPSRMPAMVRGDLRPHLPCHILDSRRKWWPPDWPASSPNSSAAPTVSLIDRDEFGVLVVGGGITRSPEGQPPTRGRRWPASHRCGTGRHAGQ
jgi:hypothetical protein